MTLSGFNGQSLLVRIAGGNLQNIGNRKGRAALPALPFLVNALTATITF